VCIAYKVEVILCVYNLYILNPQFLVQTIKTIPHYSRKDVTQKWVYNPCKLIQSLQHKSCPTIEMVNKDTMYSFSDALYVCATYVSHC